MTKPPLLDQGFSKLFTQPSTPREPIILPHLEPAKASEVYDSYWRFATERQKIFFRRISGQEPPWTNDRVLARYKFTNAYRASDRVSQYLIRNVIYRDDLLQTPSEVFFRILLFKLFNKIETWELLEQEFGVLTFKDYRFKSYDKVLTRAMKLGSPIYSAAYIMPPGKRSYGRDVKHQNHLLLLERMMEDRLADQLVDARSMQEGFEKLLEYPTIGDFLAYQLITDINYSDLTDFKESEFVVPGPGARDGIRKCFVDTGGLSEPELIKKMADIQEHEFERLDLDFQSLWGRRLQLVDCQNLFCEVDKYARVAHPEVKGRTGRTRIRQRFIPTESPIELFYPPKWNINEKIGRTTEATSDNHPRSRKTLINFDRYQQEALKSNHVPKHIDLTVPMLGLVGETGQLLAEYKKHLRDGDAHELFKERVSEELGDVLWYVSSVASYFDLSLSAIAVENLAKVQDRWTNVRSQPLIFDLDLPEGERLPRQLKFEFVEVKRKSNRNVQILVNGVVIGDDLTDNAYDSDGYRFHDIFHFAFAAVLGWSPITRKLLSKKRKSQPQLDEVEDGGRAAVIEEGVVALAFDYARNHRFLRGISTLDSQLLRTIQDMTSHLEVNRCTTREWEQAILQGFKVWREVHSANGGTVGIDLDARNISFLSPP